MRNGPVSAGNFTRIAGAATTVVATGPRLLKRIVVGTPVASSTIQVQDGNGTTNVAITTITNTAATPPPSYVVEFQVKCANGIRIITSGADDIAVVWE